MRFIRGNIALKDHIKNGKRVFLFIQDIKSFVKFETELELIDFDFFLGPDRGGKERTAIKFFFKRMGQQLNYPKEHFTLTTAAEHEESGEKNIPNVTERKGLVISRVGQGAYRKSVLYRWNFRCAVTNYTKNEILIASHIVPWKNSTNEERLDVDNGILLSPIYDALFDKHLISFENSGKIILSDSLLKTKFQDIGVSGKESIKKLSIGNYSYLDMHREKFSL